MSRIIYDKYNKVLIPTLPRADFAGKIVVVITEKEAEEAVDYLLQQPILGFDTETRPMFKKGESRPVALLQVSSSDVCFLFRLNIIGMPDCIIRLLENTRVPIIGLALHDDLLSLKKRRRFSLGNFIDLQDMVGKLGIKDMGLQKLYANIFGERIVKREQLSNWENQILTDKQKQYAATDAWACLMLYNELSRLIESRDYELVVTEEDTEKETENHDDI